MRGGLAAVVGLVGMVGAAAAFAATGGVSWGKAIDVPGAKALNAHGYAFVESISCRSPRNCTAGGSY